MSQIPNLEVLIAEEDIQRRIVELAAEIAGALPSETLGEEWVMVGLLKGAVTLVADLSRALHRHDIRLALDYMRPSSYGAGEESSGTVVLEQALSMDVSGRHVLLVDDIVDTGRTLALAQRHLWQSGAASVRTVVLTDKPERREVQVPVEHVGFEVPNRFIVGFGLDADQRWRELPYVGAFLK